MDWKDVSVFVGILVTFSLGVWNLVANSRNSKKTAFINTVTSERVKWIGNLRENISAFCGLIHTWRASGLANTPDGQDVVSKIDKLRYLIRLQLNPEGDHDKKIEEFITNIPDLASDSLRAIFRWVRPDIHSAEPTPECRPW